MEMPVRTPGAPTWPAVAKHGREVRRQQERQRRLQEKVRDNSRTTPPFLHLVLPRFISGPLRSRSHAALASFFFVSPLCLLQERRLKERALRREEAFGTRECSPML